MLHASGLSTETDAFFPPLNVAFWVLHTFFLALCSVGFVQIMLLQTLFLFPGKEICVRVGWLNFLPTP